MRLSKQELLELYGQRTARTTRRQEECLRKDTLERIATGELSLAERERVADHLIACMDCAEEYRLIPSLKAWTEQVANTLDATPSTQRRKCGIVARADYGLWWLMGAMRSPARIRYAFGVLFGVVILTLGVSNLSLHRLTARLHERLAQRDRAIATAEQEVQQQLKEVGRRVKQDETQIAELRQALSAFSQPQLNVPIVDLDPRDSFLRGPVKDSVGTIVIPSGANLFTLILNVAGRVSYPNYALEIRNLKNEIVWRGSGLRKSSYDTFTIVLPRALMPAGQYQIKLYGLRPNRQELVEAYILRIQYD